MYKMASKLVQAIDIKTTEELKKYTIGMNFYHKKIVRDVILKNFTYEKAGERFEISKQAVYKLIKVVYKKKYGVEYGKG